MLRRSAASGVRGRRAEGELSTANAGGVAERVNEMAAVAARSVFAMLDSIGRGILGLITDLWLSLLRGLPMDARILNPRTALILVVVVVYMLFSKGNRKEEEGELHR